VGRRYNVQRESLVDQIGSDAIIDESITGDDILDGSISSADLDTSYATASHTHTLTDVTDAGTAASKDVPAAGDASTIQVVKGDDTRLTDDRDPNAHTHPMSEITDAGTSATLNVPASGDAAVGEVVKGNDTRLTDTRDPNAHTHTESEISDLQSYALSSSLTSHLNDTTDAHDASAISVDSTNLDGVGTDVQTVVEELEDQIDTHTHTESDITDLGSYATSTELNNHITDSNDAHDASAISVDSTNLDGVGTDVQTVLEELEDQIDAVGGGHTHVMADITDAGTSATLNVAAAGDAAAGEVVKGNDTRLTDARTPTGHNHTLSEITDAGTAAASAATDFVAVTGDTMTGVLTLSGTYIDVQPSTSNAAGYRTRVSGDAANRWFMYPTGQMFWGDGTGATDVSLQRSAAGILKIGAGYKFQQNEAPATGDDLTNKTYVDGEISSHTHTESDITDLGTYFEAADSPTWTGSHTFSTAPLMGVQSFADSGSIVATGGRKVVFTTGASKTLTLPAASVGLEFEIINVSSNAVTISRAGSDTIVDGTATGNTSVPLPAGAKMTIECYASATWYSNYTTSLAKTGEITVSTGTGNQSFTGIGFRPTNLMLFTAGGGGASGSEGMFGFGAASDTSSEVASAIRADSTDGQKSSGTGRIYRILDDNDATPDADGSLVSFDADGFTLNRDTSSGANHDIAYIATR